MLKYWKTILGLFTMVLAIIFNWGWFWAFFIFLGLLNMLKSRSIHFIEEVTQDDAPLLYWTMIVIWVLLGIYSMVNYLFPI